MECVYAAAANEIESSDASGELVEVALKAMQTEPKDRYRTVVALQKAIREYQSHSESIALLDNARRQLAEAEKSASAAPGAKALEMNVTDEGQVRAVIDRIVGEYGRLDVLVNNAGVNSLAQRVPIDQWHCRGEWDLYVIVGTLEQARPIIYEKLRDAPKMRLAGPLE